MRHLRLPALATVLLAVSVASAQEAPADKARLFPPEAVVYVEIRSPGVFFDLLETFTRPEGHKGFDKGFEREARELDLTPEKFLSELKQVKSITFILTAEDIAAERESGIEFADMGDRRVLHDATLQRYRKRGEGPVDTTLGVDIYKDLKDPDDEDDEDSYECFIGHYHIDAPTLAQVKSVLRRLRGEKLPSLADDARYRVAMKGRDATAPMTLFLDVPRLHAHLQKTKGEDRKLQEADAVFDFKSIDTVVADARVRGRALTLDGTVRFSGENLLMGMLQMKATPRTVSGFVPTTYPIVIAGTLSDGKTQWTKLMAFFNRVLELQEGMQKEAFAGGIAMIERAFGINIAEELGNVTDHALALRPPKPGAGDGPEVLAVLRVKSVKRVKALMDRLAQAAADQAGVAVREIGENVEGVNVRHIFGDAGAWAVTDDVVLLAGSTQDVAEAIRARRRKTAIVDDAEVKRITAVLHKPCSTLGLVDLRRLSRLLAGDGPKVDGVVGVSTVVKPRHLEVRLHVSDVDSLVSLMQGPDNEDEGVPPEDHDDIP